MLKTKESKTTYKKYTGLKITLIVVAVLLITAIAGTYVMFREEIGIISSIRKTDGEHPFYMMDFKDGYHLDELLESDVSTDQELADILTGYISHGFYSPPAVSQNHIGCSTLTCKNEAGHILWGRNFDWYDSVPIVVRATPKDGYASISTCEFSNITGDYESLPEDFSNKFLAVAAYYVPMDGINEKGLCVADLEVNEGGQKLIESEKKNITITMAIRMLLDKAATVDEAIALLNDYDICPSGSISAHLSISDRCGKAVVAEFMDGKVEVTETQVVTNFNITNGDISAGGESAQKRFETLSTAYDTANGVMTKAQLTSAMESASQKDGAWKTRWTVIYEDPGEDTGEIDAVFYREGDYQNGYTISLK